jgi:glutamine amidotransferase
MCRLYGFRANELTKVECTLVHAQNALISQSRQDTTARLSHGHGWGIATYKNHLPHVEREAWAAYHGEHFKRAAARTYSKVALAHIRRATVGPAAIENTHPFLHGPWTLIHNGTIPNFDLVRPRMLDAITPEHRAAIGGVTDSEHLFRMLMSLHERSPSRPILEILREGIRQLIAWCGELSPAVETGLNVILTDGSELVGTRWGRSLCYIERNGIYDCEICGFPHIHHHPARHYRAVVVASEPITHESWTELPERSIYAITRDLRLQIESL